MGRKSAHSGMSPKDRSINLMDKFIQRNDRRNKDHLFSFALENYVLDNFARHPNGCARPSPSDPSYI